MFTSGLYQWIAQNMKVMVEKAEDDSSSSEDEISKDALKEAADHEFLKENFFSKASTADSKESQEINQSSKPNLNATSDKQSNTQKTNLPSLRKKQDEEDQFHSFGVTPTFQSFVAKKLAEIIDRSIKLKEKEETEREVSLTEKESERNNIGVKLLYSSKNLLSAEEDPEVPIKYKKQKRKSDALTEADNVLRCKEVAVNAERILSKEETKAWTPKRNNLEFKYKRLKNGVLVEKV